MLRSTLSVKRRPKPWARVSHANDSMRFMQATSFARIARRSLACRSGRHYRTRPRLRERHLGVLQGLTGAEAIAGQPKAWTTFKSRDPDLVLDGGETWASSTAAWWISWMTFAIDTARPRSGCNSWRCPGCGVSLHTGHALSVARDFPIYNASVNVLSHDNRGWRIESWVTSRIFRKNCDGRYVKPVTGRQETGNKHRPDSFLPVTCHCIRSYEAIVSRMCWRNRWSAVHCGLIPCQ
jgi:probable phosphoglycerate mutase